MFNVSQQEARRYFASVWQNRHHKNLDAQQKKVLAIIIEHPEYQSVLENIEQYLDYQWLPEEGQNNPFLHMSLHLSLLEQYSINQPEGISVIYQALLEKNQNTHLTEHVMMDALTEMIWQAQRYSNGFDVNLYITLLREKLDLPPENHPRLNPHEI